MIKRTRHSQTSLRCLFVVQVSDDLKLVPDDVTIVFVMTENPRHSVHSLHEVILR